MLASIRGLPAVPGRECGCTHCAVKHYIFGKKSNCVLLACKNTQEAALSTQTFVFVNSEERLARVCAYTELGE